MNSENHNLQLLHKLKINMTLAHITVIYFIYAEKEDLMYKKHKIACLSLLHFFYS